MVETTTQDDITNEDDDFIISPDMANSALKELKEGAVLDDEETSEQETETEEEEGDDETETTDEESGDDVVTPTDTTATVAPNEKQALLKEITTLRQKLAAKRVTEMAESVPDDIIANDDKTEKLKELGYSDEAISEFEQAFDIIAEKKGYVRKATTYKDILSETVNEFTAEHPEYLPVNDKDDARWSAFEEIINSGIYDYRTPKPKETLKLVLEKVHIEVSKKFGTPTVGITEGEKAAQRQKIQSVASTGGGGGSLPTKPTVKKSPVQMDPKTRSMFKGFDDDDLS